MRLLVIEKDKTDADGDSAEDNTNGSSESIIERSHVVQQSPTANEEDPLLPASQHDQNKDPYAIHTEPNFILQSFPILYCFRDPRLITSLFLTCIQAVLLSSFNATIPTEADDLFGFSSLTSGLLFIALDIPYVALSLITGWAVDRFGVKPAAVLGYTILVPTLALLRLPCESLVDGPANIALYCVLLALNGMGVAVVGSPAVVEQSKVVQNYTKANPKFFGENGFRSVFYCGGLTIGPFLSGSLRSAIGYGNMNAVLAGIAGLAAFLSIFIVGGTPRFLSRHQISAGNRCLGVLSGDANL